MYVCETFISFQKSPAVSNGVAPTKPAEKKGPQSAIANMFAKSNKQKPAAKTEQKTEEKGKKEVTDGKKNDKKVCEKIDLHHFHAKYTRINQIKQ